MKFKSLFIFFNIVLLLLLLGAVFSFSMSLGEDSLETFLGGQRLFVLIFLGIILGVDLVFLLHWGMFSLLEKENWSELLAWLERAVYEKNRLNRVYAGLLINTALTLVRLAPVKRLGQRIRTQKPALLKPLGVYLGIPWLLEKDPQAIADHYAPLLTLPHAAHGGWARWAYGLSHLLSKRLEEAGKAFLPLLQSRDPALRLAALHLMPSLPDFASAAAQSRRELAGVFAGEKGEKLLARCQEENLMALVFAPLLGESRRAVLGGS